MDSHQKGEKMWSCAAVQLATVSPIHPALCTCVSVWGDRGRFPCACMHTCEFSCIYVHRCLRKDSRPPNPTSDPVPNTWEPHTELCTTHSWCSPTWCDPTAPDSWGHCWGLCAFHRLLYYQTWAPRVPTPLGYQEDQCVSHRWHHTTFGIQPLPLENCRVKSASHMKCYPMSSQSELPPPVDHGKPLRYLLQTPASLSFIHVVRNSTLP